MIKAIFYEYDVNHQTIIPIVPGGLFYLKKHLAKEAIKKFVASEVINISRELNKQPTLKETNTLLVNVVFLDTNRDLLYESCLETISKKLFIDTDKPKPSVFIGNASLFGSGTDNKIDQRKKFLDSSIWLHYIEGFEKFSDKLSQIFKLHKKELYETHVALEHIELQGRLLINSHLIPVGGHARHVHPFIFHSETEMKIKYEQIMLNDKVTNSKNRIPAKDLTKLNAKIFKWRFLLIDDHIFNENEKIKTNPLSPFDKISGDPDEYKKLTKNYIIENLLGTLASKASSTFLNNNCKVEIELVSVSSIDDAIKKIKSGKVFDIILLDYLLGYDNKNERKFGSSFLEELQNHTSLKAPLNYFWIFVMTSFPAAFFDKIREMGLDHHSDCWRLARGADPVNTPELFRYSLLQLLELQFKEADLRKDKIFDHFLVNMTFNEDDDIRSWAKSYYQIFISRFGVFHQLKQDKECSSFSNSMFSFIKDYRIEDIEFYEKARNFIYLLAHGTHDAVGQLLRSYEEFMLEINDLDKKQNLDNFAVLKKHIITYRG